MAVGAYSEAHVCKTINWHIKYFVWFLNKGHNVLNTIILLQSYITSSNKS